MTKTYYETYCSRGLGEEKDAYFALRSKGAAVAVGVTYPTRDSRSDIVCKKVLDIGVESFVRRPSLEDVAVDTIASFINEGIYIYQERDKAFLCNAALLFILHGRARWIVSGNAVIYRFQDGCLADRVTGCNSPLFGERVHWKEKCEPAFDLSGGINSFVLCSAAEDVPFPETYPVDVELTKQNPAPWAKAALSAFDGMQCSAASVVLPRSGFGRTQGL